MARRSVQTEGDDPLDREYAEAYRPEPGDRIRRGEITFINTRSRSEAYGGGRYVIVTVRIVGESSTERGGEPIEPGEERAVHALHTVLANELAAIKPRIGDEISLRYEGKHPDRDYHRWRVAKYGEGSGDVDWSEFGGEEVEGDEDVPGDSSKSPTHERFGNDNDSIPF